MVIIDWIRGKLFGRCPKCKSVRVKDVKGWDKTQCKDCGHTWRW